MNKGIFVIWGENCLLPNKLNDLKSLGWTHCALVGKYSKHTLFSLLHSFSHTIVSVTSVPDLYPHVEKQTKEDFVLVKVPGFDGDRRQD